MYKHFVLLTGLFSLSMVVLACTGFDGVKVPPREGEWSGVSENFRALAEKGNADAQLNLGWMYANGEGVPQDYAEAVKWYRKAAEQGDKGAQLRLEKLHADGKVVPQDYAEAEESWRKANEQRNANLGVRATEIPLQRLGGVYEVPVKINGVITLGFVLDTGASEVTIPADVALTLLRTGTITQKDFLPGKSYQMADGSIVRSSRFILRELDLGGIKITQVPASIAPATASLLLGQSFLARIESWALDNKRHVLIIGGVR
jgi:clan AA aspartic protease (TIGR02281 family)